jgi:hypothetical protein
MGKTPIEIKKNNDQALQGRYTLTTIIMHPMMFNHALGQADWKVYFDFSCKGCYQ